MKKILYLLILIPFLGFSQPKEETRAVWFTTNWALDWPKTSGIDNQKNEIKAIFDKLVAANFNTVMFQVRSRGDLLYPSSIEPWAACMGSLGSNPGWDPFRFAIDEAHARGLEIHAWFVTFRVWSSSSNPSSTSPQHVALSHPEWVTNFTEGSTTTKWLDPGIPAARDYVKSIVDEIITNYSDVDGIHFDYCRYPEATFDDATTYSTYGNGQDKAQWRRDNINTFMADVYSLVQNKAPNVKVGSAPIGIYKNLTNATGWEAYHVLGQDARQWMNSGNHDYICPQIYWDIASNPQFPIVAEDWVNNVSGRHVYTGHNAAGLGKKRGSEKFEEHVLARQRKTRAWSASEILNQIDVSRQKGAKGQCYYRYSHIGNNTASIYDQMKAGQYAYPANIPSMSWKDNVAPNAPRNLTINDYGTYYTLGWNAPETSSDGDGAKYYNIYEFDSPNVDLSDIKKVVKFKVTAEYATFNTSLPADKYYVVTAYDKGYNESTVSNLVGTSTPVDIVVLSAPANKATGVSTNAVLSWNAYTGASTYDVQVSEKSDFSSLVVNQTGVGTTSINAGGLNYNTKYFWKVKADNTTSWSEVAYFTTELRSGSVAVDDFEAGQGHFTSALTLSGSTKGISTTSTLVQHTGTNIHRGGGALEAVMVDDAASTDNWLVRLLSGGGTPANNTAFEGNGTISFWMASYGATGTATVCLWIDDSDGLEQSQQITVINDGHFHKYTFNLDDYQGSTITTGNGQIDGATVTLDAIIFRQNNNSDNWTVYIDDVISDPNTSVAPVAAFTANETAVVEGQQVTFTNQSTDASSYTWTFNGGTPSTSTDANPVVTYSTAGTYDVTLVATGDGGTDTKTMTGYITVEALDNVTTPAICIVSVDDAANKNQVIWDRPVSNSIASYKIYKETYESGNYELIGTQNYSDGNTFADANSQPDVKAERYKVSAVDALGNETELSTPHKTIHLSINKGTGTNINLIWDGYEGFEFASYNIYRGTSINDLALLVQVQSNLNSYTDVNAPTGDVFYQVEVINPNDCSNGGLKSKPWKSSKSNIAHQVAVATGIADDLSNGMKFYPNPARNALMIELNDIDNAKTVEFINLQGQVVKNCKINERKSEIDISQLPKGIYFVKIDNLIKKLVKQ